MLHHTVADFLSVHNGGIPQKARFDYTDFDGHLNTGEVLEFLPLSRADKDDVRNVTLRLRKEGRIGGDFLVIARESGGNLIIVENKAGKVFLWDRQKEQESPENITFLAVSLHCFFLQYLVRS